MPLFGKQPSNNKQSPLDTVLQLRSSGYANEQIVSTLQQQGLSSPEILDALNQADNSPAQDWQQQPQDPSFYPQQGFTQQPQQPPEQMQQPAYTPPAYPPHDNERIEEVAEAIINEKWNDLLRDINKMAEWKDRAETRLVKIEQDLQNLKDGFQNLQRGILGKVQQYDQNIQNVGAEIKAMEKVFQDVLPKFTENVNRMARFVDKK